MKIFKFGIEFVKELPEVNFSENIIITERARDNLKADWIEFVEVIIRDGYNGIDFKKEYKSLANYKYGDKRFYALPIQVKRFAGIDEDICILKSTLKYDMYILELNIDYEKLFSFLNSNKGIKFTSTATNHRSVIQNFILFQIDNNKLLCPMHENLLYHSQANIYEKYLLNHKLYKGLLDSIAKKNYTQNTNKEYLKIIKLFFYHTNWNNISTVTDESLSKYQRLCYEGQYNANYSKVINHLREYLIDCGRVDISHPQVFTNSVRKSQQKNSYEMQNPFGWLDVEPENKLYQIKQDALEYLEKLKADGLQLGTIKKNMVALNILLRFLVSMKINSGEINEEFIKTLYAPKSPNNLFGYLLTLNNSERTSIENVSLISRFLAFCGLMTPYSKKYIPKQKIGKRKITHRSAMPADMLKHLIEIITKRPPKSNTLWDKDKADISWWAFKDVYPVQPIMMLMHLMIPIRGGQLRHLCRKLSIVTNYENTEVDRFIINTDKNVNRDELQEIPNVWSELNILADYLKWNKEYFPYIKPYKYNNDDNTPWEDIEPLFLIPSNPIPITLFQHKAYFNKLLCVYQMEMNEKYKNNEFPHQIEVAKMKDGSPFFETMKELDATSDSRLEGKVEVAYDIHSIRVTGITRYLESGLNLTILQSLTGHVDSNMIVSVYTKFTYEEKKKLLRNASDKVLSYNNDDLLSNSEDFVFNEMPKYLKNSNQKDVKKVFRENGLFSLPRKSTALFEDTYDVDLGTDIAIDIHPSLWKPMVHGICPSVSCLEGRDRKCSICPYFITGVLYVEGLKHMANLAMLSFHRLTKEFAEDKKASTKYGNSKSSVMELLMEEILGWHEIINKIEEDINKVQDDDNLPMVVNEKKIGLELMPVELSYLQTCYQAKLMGVEQDHYGLKVLTIRAIKIANDMRNSEEVSNIINNEERAIDYLMTEYNKSKEENLLPNFIKKLGIS